MSPNIFIPKDAIERGLMRLPRDCNCIVCKLQKAEAKARLGEDRYEEVYKKIGLVK